jgi:tetratricopeptide (TPR) repeat protein
MIPSVSLLLAGLIFQAPTDPSPVQVAEATAPSPRVIAERNPALSDELRGDIMMARKMYLDAIDFYKPQANTNAVLANKAGIAYHQMGDLNNAKKYYERAIKLDKKYAEAINNLGTIHYARKSYGNAIKQYEKALQLTPNSPSVLTNLGTAYFARKKYDEAIRYYARAVALDPLVFDRRGSNGLQVQERSVEERARFHYTLAKTFAQAGLLDQALQNIRFALEYGFKERDKFKTEAEFAGLQSIAAFQQLMTTEPSVL